MAFNIHLDTRRFEGLNEALKKAMKRATERSVGHVTNVAHNYAPRKTGNLKRSIHSDGVRSAGGAFLGKVVQDSIVAPYGKFVERGTGIYGPHRTPIVPKTKPFLVWKSNGRWYRKRSVKGQRPQLFMRRAFLESKVVIKGIFQEELDKAFKEAMR